MFGYGFRFRSMLKTSFIKKKDELKATVAKKKKRVLISILMPLFAAGSTKDCQDAPVKRPAPLFEHFDTECGLGSMVTIRDVGRNPFITLSALDDYLTLLAAFQQLQTEPGFVKRSEWYATEYKKYAHFTVPRYCAASAKVQEAFDPDSLNYSAAGKPYQDFSVPSVSSQVGSVRDGALGRSHTGSTLNTLLDTPISGSSFCGNEFYSPLTFFVPSAKLSYDEPESYDVSERSSSIRSNLFFARSQSSAMTSAPGSSDLPLPPIGVLLAWHAHLMRPDHYDLGTQALYKNLVGVPFPLREAAEAIRHGTLPLELQLCRPDDDLSPNDHYHHGFPTIDIVNLINAQTCFIEYCHSAGMLEKGLLRKNQAPGNAAITRYHGYMKLMQTVENNHHLEPTLDVELAWKCHRLNHDAYCKDTAGFADAIFFSTYCSTRRETWSNIAHYEHDYKKETQKAWGKRFKGDKFYKTT